MTIDYGSGNVITLPNVQWNDKYSLNLGLVPKASRHGTQSTFLRSNTQEVRHYSVKTVKASYVSTLRTLLLTFLGQTATINDGIRSYTGIIYSDVLEVVSIRGNSTCESYDLELDILVTSAISTNQILTEGGEVLLTEGGEDLLTEAG